MAPTVFSTATIFSALFFCTFASQIVSQSGDPDDLSFIKKWAAIGDSYAAGIGAGNLVDKSCSRYDGSYANLVNVQLGEDTSNMDFTYIACSGAKIPEITAQANSLDGGQQMITISAGGNDAQLTTALNDCVFTFKAIFSGNCGATLNNIQTIIDSDGFASSIDGLISAAKTKLAPGGTIYYTGYAQFFDATTNNCDSVSWHVWLSLFTRQYLTQANRQRMNDLVIDVNNKISAAVQNAGDQVVFIDYDDYVGFLGGRYCLPGVNEDKGQGANRDFLFFYESKTTDTPFMPPNDDPYHDELRRRDANSSTVAPLNTLDGELGSWMQQTIEQNSSPQLNDDVANSDLNTSIANEEQSSQARKRAPIPMNRRRAHEHNELNPHYYPRANFYNQRDESSLWTGTSSSIACATGSASGASGCISGTTKSTGFANILRSSIKQSVSKNPSQTASPPYPFQPSFRSAGSFGLSGSGVYPSGTHVSGLSHSSASIPRAYLSGASKAIFPSGTASASLRAFVQDDSHNQFSDVKVHEDGLLEDSAIVSFFIPDSFARVFHPQQGGHALIANLIMYTMAAQNAKSMGQAYAPQNLTDIGSSCPLPVSPACNGSSSDTWAGRDAIVSAAASFCANFTNVAGATGTSTSGTFNPNSFDYLSLSIAWNDDISIGENQCNTWFDTVIDGCDTTALAKHGGSIGYAANATLSVDPLVVRQIWDGGQASAHQCNGLNNNNYVTQATLATNIQNFCSASAAQPNGIANSGSTFSKDYNAGTPDHMTLSTTWPTGPRNFQIFADECNFYLGTIMNGCDVPGNGANPMNWKHGGTMKDNNGVLYTITPNANRAPPPNAPLGSCTSWYKFIYATFDVSGGGWADSDFGQDPGGVMAQIKGCGGMTAWKFDYFGTPASDGTEWHASGTLPIGTRRCLGRAVKSSGGFGGGCGGNG